MVEVAHSGVQYARGVVCGNRAGIETTDKLRVADGRDKKHRRNCGANHHYSRTRPVFQSEFNDGLDNTADDALGQLFATNRKQKRWGLGRYYLLDRKGRHRQRDS
jgi:hypothetical protein